MSSRAPLVGITCGTASVAGQTPRYGTNQAYAAAVIAAGGVPVLLVPGTAARPEVLELVDALLVPGGADVDPSNYGAPTSAAVEYTDPPRDQLEVGLVREARRRGLPVFGICRGMQAINVAFGGSLYQDIPTEVPGALRHQSPVDLGRAHLEHDIVVEPGSWFADAAGTALMVNSLHHQAVREVGSGLLVTARSEDGVVEGLETADRQTVAVQCHPEEILELHWARSMFQRFVAAAAG